MAFPRFNRRHKFVLFLTVVVTGLSLSTGIGVDRSLGVAILGCSLAWVIGSDSVIRLLARIPKIKDKLDRKSPILNAISVIICAALILGGIACLGASFDPESIGARAALLLASLVAFALAFLLYKQSRVWAGVGKGKCP